MKLILPSRVSRRLGERFFFKAERDATQKSAMVRRPYPPGMHGKRRRRAGSEFALELAEKQKVRHFYGITDTALGNYVREATRMAGRNKTKTTALLELLERRLDNTVHRLGLAASRRIARQMVGHGHILVDGRRAAIPSRTLRPGDRIQVRAASRGMPIFGGLPIRLKKYQPPEWLRVDAEKAEGEVVRQPLESDNLISYNLSKVIEFYSR